MSEETNLTSTAAGELLTRIRTRTPARVLADRAGAGYRTPTLLELREAHATARDAVRAELDLERDLGAALIETWNLFEVSTQARSKDEYLLRPDLGRRFSQDAARTVQARCRQGADLQIAIGDGLSVTAVSAQVPRLLPLLAQGVKDHGWTLGQPLVVRHCRVGIMNEIGELLHPQVVALLIGERPGLATAESLSVYMAYRPSAHDSDAQRNLISNIHGRGVLPERAAQRVLNLTSRMLREARSGSELKEEFAETESFKKLGSP